MRARQERCGGSLAVAPSRRQIAALPYSDHAVALMDIVAAARDLHLPQPRCSGPVVGHYLRAP